MIGIKGVLLPELNTDGGNSNKRSIHTGCVWFEGRNAFCALVLLTLWPGDKPLHRLNLSLNKVHTTFSVDALTAGFLLHSTQPADTLKANSIVARLKGPLVIYGQWALNACLQCVSANFTLIPRGVGPEGSVTPRTTGQHPLWLPGNKAEGTFRGEGWGPSF